MDSNNKDKKKCIYLDYNGTTPIYPPVLGAMLPYLTEHYGNPSSSHYYGQEPKLAVNKARRSILRLIQPPHNTFDAVDVSEEEYLSSIVFTGCGTESNNLAIRLALLSSQHKADDANDGTLHVISTNIEHPAITQCLNAYTKEDGNGTLTPQISITYIPVNEQGIISTQNVIDAIRPNTVLVTIMTANNEVGSIQPVFEIAKICRQKHVLFHTDAAQAVGKIDLQGLAHLLYGADFVTIVGHKFGAPKGIAALYIRPNCFDEDERIDPQSFGGSVLLMGGGQEHGRRGGTENVPYIVGMAKAADMLFEKKQQSDKTTVDGWMYNSQHMAAMRERLLHNLERGLGEGGGDKTIVRTNGPLNPDQRLPNTLSVGLKGILSGELLENIGHVVACSAGSACHSSSSSQSQGQMSYSAILKAMNVPPEYALGTLRLSVGPDTTADDVDLAAEIIVKEAKRQLSS